MRRGAEVGKGFKQENVRKAVSTETKGGKAKGRHRPLRFQPRGKYTQSVTATSGLTGGGEAGAGILGPCQPPCREDGVGRGTPTATAAQLHYRRGTYSQRDDRLSSESASGFVKDGARGAREGFPGVGPWRSARCLERPPEPAGSAGRQGRRRAGGGEWEADPINLKLLFYNVLSHFGGWGSGAGCSLLPGRFS